MCSSNGDICNAVNKCGNGTSTAGNMKKLFLSVIIIDLHADFPFSLVVVYIEFRWQLTLVSP